MESTRTRMILVAVLVTLFAVGMAGLLNYFKYRSTADRIVKERLLVIGNSIVGSIQSSLALGIQLNDLNTLQSTMERERATDELILSIEVFDTDGQPLYSTDRLRAERAVSPAWMGAAKHAGDGDWFVEDGGESAAGVSIKNSFGLRIGYLAVRFSADRVRDAHAAVARDLATAAFLVWVIAAALASLALLGVMRRLTKDVAAVEAALRSPDPSRLPEAVRRGPFGTALARFFETVTTADTKLLALRASLDRGNGK